MNDDWTPNNTGLSGCGLPGVISNPEQHIDDPRAIAKVRAGVKKPAFQFEIIKPE